MSAQHPIAVDGIDYGVEIKNADVVFVYDSEGQMVASAEKDHAVEQIFCRWYTAEEGCVRDEIGPRDLFDEQNLLDVARWLVGTQE